MLWLEGPGPCRDTAPRLLPGNARPQPGPGAGESPAALRRKNEIKSLGKLFSPCHNDQCC